MINLPENKQLILFDGVCNLCIHSIQFVIKHDKKDVFRFAALQSDIGEQLMTQFNIDKAKSDTILLYSKGKGLKNKSTATLLIAKQLSFPVKFWCVFLIVPALLRNWVYDYVAKNRYKWYGKKDECMLPTSEIKSKFLK